MLNIGLIGNTEILEPFAKRIQDNKSVNVIGKSSVGKGEHLNGFHFSIPEFNRVELVERSDIILMDNSSVLPFKLLCDMVKKSKHLFFAEYLDLTSEECKQLISLANESGSVVQVYNPLFFSKVIQWISKHKSAPIYLEISNLTEEDKGEEFLFQFLLMLIGITGISPKRLNTVTFNSEPENSSFTHVRMEYGDASVVSLNYGKQSSRNDFQLKYYSKDQFVRYDFIKEELKCNGEKVDLSTFKMVDEFTWFFETISNNRPKISSLEHYLQAIELAENIDKKLNQFYSL